MEVLAYIFVCVTAAGEQERILHQVIQCDT